MSKFKNNANFNGRTEKAKIIFVGRNKFQMKKAQRLARENQCDFLVYSEEEWATLEEIDQYIQEEELSERLIKLPMGRKTGLALDEIEEETIKRAVKNSNGNILQAANALKIARATLYRKMERYGLSLKKQREEQIKKQKKILKRVA